MPVEILDESIQSMPATARPKRQPSSDGVSPAVREQLQQFALLTGLGLSCVDAHSGAVVAETESDSVVLIPAKIRRELPQTDRVRVIDLPSGLVYYLLPLSECDESRLIAVGCSLRDTETMPQELVLAAAERDWSQQQLDRWRAAHAHRPTKLIESLLSVAMQHQEHLQRQQELESEIEHLSDQIEVTYEEISLLHTLAHNLQISRSPVDLAQMCLERMHGLIKASGNAIWIQDRDGSAHFLVEGDVPVDDVALARLLVRFEDHDWSQPVVKNRMEGTLIGADFPGLRNLVLVPIAEKQNRSGWILSANMLEGHDFGSVEASLISSVATILGTHLRNIDLYEQHNELLLSFVRSLVSTLDAKDQYTRGHSERVALIARRLGEEFQLPNDDLHDIYVAGLLHDIGKIGVDDRILQKPGQLSDQEFQKIQQHPLIGYSILQGLKNLRKVLPGVRSHHETYAGDGYPDKLKGDEIPLMARILAVADSFDAMGSDRPYRKGMPVERIEEIFQRGAGRQWDPRVIEAYFAVRDDILNICEDYGPTDGNLLPASTADIH